MENEKDLQNLKNEIFNKIDEAKNEIIDYFSKSSSSEEEPKSPNDIINEISEGDK